MDTVRKINGKVASKNNCASQIRKFYASKNVFLTGCTGFLGILVLEKLLRTCTEIGKIYIMIREKRGVSIEERFKELFRDDAFDKLREVIPSFMEKVVLVYGELNKNHLGLSIENRQRLIANVNIIIHIASIVKFKANVSLIFRANVIGTQNMLELAAECSNLEAFVYVSTAYSHSYNNTVEEKFYPPPADMKLVNEMIRADEECPAGINEKVVNEIVGKFKNIYCFSKSIAEGLVEDFGRRKSLPCIVFRPSIIIQSYLEPFPSWARTENGPAQMKIAAAVGAFNTMHTNDMNAKVDCIPVDMTTNSLLAVIWDYVTHRKSNGPAVYNYGSSDWNPLSIKMYIEMFISAARRNPTLKTIWYPWVVNIKNSVVLMIINLLTKVFRFMIFDLIFIVQFKKPKLRRVFIKVEKQLKHLTHFIYGNWTIKTDNIKDIQNRMNTIDLEEFPFDLQTIDWCKCMELSMMTVRRTLKDPPDTLPQAKRKLQKLKILHYTVCGLVVLLLLFLFYRIMCVIVNIF